MSIHNIPLEVLRQITDKTPKDHKWLRTVCRALNAAVAPAFFSSIVLDVPAEPLKLELGLSHLEALAAGETMWSQYARTIVIKRLSPGTEMYKSSMGKGTENSVSFEDIEFVTARLQGCLGPALDALKLIETVIWHFDSDRSDESLWIPEAIHEFIASLPSQIDFRLETDEPGFARNYDCDFARITNLRKLSIKSSDDMTLANVCRALSHAVGRSDGLEFLHLEARHSSGGVPPLHSLDDLFPGLTKSDIQLRLTELRVFRCSIKLDAGTMPHLKSLRSLWWFDGNWEIWNALRGVHLVDLHTDQVSDDMLEYVASYSGLKRLVIKYADGQDDDDSNRLADKFYESALPRHADSLVALFCRGTWEGRWSFGPHNFEQLAMLRRLESLRMNVNLVFAGYKPRDPKATFTGRGARRIFEIEKDSEGRNSVHQFLRLVNQLPITNAAILPAASSKDRNNTCGHNAITHKETAIRKIDEAIQNFHMVACRPCCTIVLGGWNYYMVSGKDGKYRAVDSAELSWPFSYEHLIGDRSW
ncbi:hypothetical protein R3P38DRAFT_2926171 [Favolaschia claudopus]|uniref:F-box domain-containing protein n=1 Tax=Favolaschia claudopus TaxID=2862362 RepID=A0AAW0C0P9_9AGAR